MEQTNMPPEVPGQMPKKEGGGSGVIAIIIILALVVLGGAYYLMTTASPMPGDEAMPTAEDVTNSEDPDVQAATTQGSSDAMADIEADMNATDFSSMDAELQGLSQ
ncbi:MAG: hypothetical protein AAB923_01425 [Patescibacteria group bacterium]